MKDVAGGVLFLKLGGSLITDKTEVESIRVDVLTRVASEVAGALRADADLRLVLGHGSGSFGHVHAQTHGTRAGVSSDGEWRGFVDVSDSALRLNRAVTAALLQAGVAAISLSPSASAVVSDGKIESLAVEPIKAALAAGLVPVIHGDVAFDTVRGGTILSTEEVMTYLAPHLRPSRLLLAGEVPGVYDLEKNVISHISDENFEAVKVALGGSRGADVTGGMATKVRDMLALSARLNRLEISIFSGLDAGNIAVMLARSASLGTTISGSDSG